MHSYLTKLLFASLLIVAIAAVACGGTADDSPSTAADAPSDVSDATTPDEGLQVQENVQIEVNADSETMVEGEVMVEDDDATAMVEDDDATAMVEGEVMVKDDDVMAMDEGEVMTGSDDDAMAMDDGEVMTGSDDDAMAMDDDEVMTDSDDDAMAMDDDEVMTDSDDDAMAMDEGGHVHGSTIVNFRLETVTIEVGTTIEWKNDDGVGHTSTFGSFGNNDGDIWDSGTLIADVTFSHTFDEAGEFPYFCRIHPSMTGTITVVDAS